MGVNREKLDYWGEYTQQFGKIDIMTAKAMFRAMQNETDEQKKARMREELINKTLYNVYDYIKNRGFDCLNSSVYDIDDVMSSATAIWISRIDSGRILEVEFFSGIFDSGFHYELTDALVSSRFRVSDFNMNFPTFAHLMYDFIKERIEDPEYSYNKFVQFITSRIGNEIAFIVPEDIYDIYAIFEGAFESISDDERYDIPFSKSRMEKIIYILISNGLEYARVNIDEVGYQGLEDAFVREVYNQGLLDIIFKEVLNEKQIELLKKSYGLDDYDEHTRKQLAIENNVGEERIRQKLWKACSKVRCSERVQEYRRL